MVFERSLPICGHTLDDGEISFRYLLPLLLKDSLGGLIPCKDHQARGLAVKAMNDECPLQPRPPERL
jgi:hypothetical protein